ncbi:MAG: hypothetical protein ACLT1T_10080 [Oscillospiraceae bacterium]
MRLPAATATPRPCSSPARANLCVPGANAVAAQIAALLGVEAEDVVEKIAVVQ